MLSSRILNFIVKTKRERIALSPRGRERFRTFACRTPGGWAGAALLAFSLAGCSSSDDGGVYADLEAVVLRERLVEVALGSFEIPVPIEVIDEAGKRHSANVMQLKFALAAVVAPGDAKQVNRISKRDAGQLRDRVIRVCRNASVDELMDPQLSTLRSRLRDSAQPLFEGDTIRRMVLDDFISEPL